MQLILHGLKFIFEGAAVLIWTVAAIFAVTGLFAGDNPDNDAMGRAIGTFGFGVLFLFGLAFFLFWFLLVHFAHLPWWG